MPDFNKIIWDMSGQEIEEESFRRIEKEIDLTKYPENSRKIIRRLIHTTADFSIADDIVLHKNPVESCIKALQNSAAIITDSNMIKSGISITKLKNINPSYCKESIKCFIADKDVAAIAANKHITRALAAVYKADKLLHNSIVLVGNAPLALAGILKFRYDKGITPAVIIGMPVGFVNVEESKSLLMETKDIPYITLKGRRGGSPLAVAAFHAMLEYAKI